MKTDLPDLTERDIEEYVAIQRAILHEKRFQILLIVSKEAASWSKLMNELDLRNPKILHDHLSTLIATNILEKGQEGLYHLTKVGKRYFDANRSQIRRLIHEQSDAG